MKLRYVITPFILTMASAHALHCNWLAWIFGATFVMSTIIWISKSINWITKEL